MQRFATWQDAKASALSIVAQNLTLAPSDLMEFIKVRAVRMHDGASLVVGIGDPSAPGDGGYPVDAYPYSAADELADLRDVPTQHDRPRRVEQPLLPVEEQPLLPVEAGRGPRV